MVSQHLPAFLTILSYGHHTECSNIYFTLILAISSMPVALIIAFSKEPLVSMSTRISMIPDLHNNVCMYVYRRDGGEV